MINIIVMVKTSSILRKVCLSIWSVVFVLLFVFCAKNVPVCVYGADEASGEKVIRIGFFEFPGYHEIDENGVRSGFGYEVLQELQPYTHWKYEYIGYKEGWPQMLDMLENEEIDLISSTIKTPQKLKLFDFSKHPLGMSGTIMTVKPGQTKFKPGDYKNWHDLRVGMLNNNDSKNDIFHEFSKEKVFYYEPTYYDSVTELQEALQKGEVDAIVTGSLRQRKNEEVFEEIGVHPFFFAVKKGNRELLDEVDNAMDRLLADKPDILKELFRKYYDVQKIHAYCPLSTDVSNGQNRHMAKYIEEFLRYICQINNWDVEVETGNPLDDGKSLSSTDLICGIIKNQEYQKILDFPLQEIGTFKVILAAKEGNDTFLKYSPENWPNSFKIGYVPCTLGCVDKLEDFANRYFLKYKYKLMDYASDAEMIQALKDGKIDLMLATDLEEQQGMEAAAVCGEDKLYFAVPKEKTAIFKDLYQTIEYLKVYQQPLLDDLADQYLTQPLSDKERMMTTYERRQRERVRVCLYEMKLEGYIKDYIARLAEMYDWDIDYIYTDYTQVFQYLAEGKVDIVPSLTYTKERAENCLYSDMDFEVIYCYLATTPSNKEMLPNQIDTWTDARIAVVNGSSTTTILSQFLNQYDVKCSFQYYDSMAEAEQSVLAGVNDAVYTFTPQGFKPLAVFPSELTYLCINKDKPELKEQVDKGMAALKRNDPNFTVGLMEKHFPSSDFNILMLDKTEMNAIYKFKDRPIRVDISPEAPPLKRYDPIEGEASGFVKRLMDEISKDTGLTFEYLPPTTSAEARNRILHGKSDIWVGFSGDTSPVGKTVTGTNSIYIPLVKVSQKTKKVIDPVNDVAAIPINDHALKSLFDRGGRKNYTFYSSREECYRAVRSGEADYTIDTLPSAQLKLWKDHRFSELIFQSTLPNEFNDPMEFIYSVEMDETIRGIIDKAMKSFTQDQIHSYLQAVTFTGIKKPFLTPVQLVALLASVALVTVLVFFFHSSSQQKRQMAIQKATSECLESLFLEEQDFEETAREIIEMLVKYFNAQLGWFARYDDDGVYLEAMVGFPKELRPDCLRVVTPETLQAWIESQENKEIQQVYYEQFPGLFTVKEWDDHLVKRNIKTIYAAVIRIGDKVSGNIAVCFDTIRPELTPTEIYMLKYFQHMIRASQIRKKLITDLKAERDHAIQAEKARSFFFACVSHDIRTPLNAIIGFSELLRYGGLDEKQVKSYLESIVFSGNVLMELVNNILDLSKLDAESMVYTYDFCDFRKLGTKVLKAFAHRVSDGNVELKMEMPSDLPALKLDSQHVYQILFNLMGNAVKFTKKGSITLKAHCEPAKDDPAKMDLEFAVCDTGIGIDKKYFDSIFKPFQQIQNMTQTGGTGLGLSICALMVEQMGGTISVDSEVGKGSTFTVKLNNLDSRPLEPEEESPEKELKTSTSAEHASLLLVDDVPMNLNVLEALCKKAGVKDIVKAQSGSEALSILKERSFTAVLTDMWMPGMSGTELAKLIRMKYNDLPIYLITADVEYLKHYKEDGFTGCLTKPLTLDKLQEIF